MTKSLEWEICISTLTVKSRGRELREEPGKHASFLLRATVVCSETL
jgi:hypothetical protein